LIPDCLAGAREGWSPRPAPAGVLDRVVVLFRSTPDPGLPDTPLLALYAAQRPAALPLQRGRWL